MFFVCRMTKRPDGLPGLGGTGRMINEESLTIVKDLSDRDHDEAIIILDIPKKRKVKDVVTTRSFEDLFAYFMVNYGDDIKGLADGKA
jgi:hypothetical protein